MRSSMIWFVVVSAIVALSSIGCGGEVEERFDCRQVCEAYADCVDDDYDVDDCVESCDEQDQGEQADDCEDCIDGQSCVEATFQCGGECAGIVP